MKLCLLTTAALEGGVSNKHVPETEEPLCMTIKREKDAIICTSDPHITSTALRNPCLHIRHWVTDFKQLWECVCVIISVWDSVMDSMCGPQQDVLFHLLSLFVCVCVLTLHFHFHFCVYRLFWLCSLIIGLYPWHSSPPTPYSISHLSSSWLLQVETCYVWNADKGESAVYIADPNLYHCSPRMGCALLWNFYNALAIH